LSTSFGSHARFASGGNIGDQIGEVCDIRNDEIWLYGFSACGFGHDSAAKAELCGLLETGSALRHRPYGARQ
jgi:hypothetical protein